jgi:hypothetical protein
MTRTATRGTGGTRGPAKIHNLAYLHRDRGYRFADRDPRMVELCSLIHDSELPIYVICNKVGEATGGAYKPSQSTVANWLNGKTRRPQGMTMDWVAFAIGYQRRWTRI